MDDLIGRDLGRYHILEQLGEGGMATVYKAYDVRLERDVAIKIIRTDQFAPALLDRILKRFEREAKALARLSHPNIVKVLDYGDFEGTPYLIMEFLPGGTLKKFLGKPMPVEQAVQLLLPIAQALEYAHEHAIIHRDIKPANILLTEKSQPMLSDFGIAKILEGEDASTLTGTGVGIGTPEYMAPEQWTGNVSAQSDQYALGVVLYEMVTGRKPYMADTPAAILLKQATEPLPKPSQFVPKIPDAVEKVLFKALAKDPENRYPNMGQFAGKLQEFLVSQAGQKVPGGEIPLPEQISPAEQQKTIQVQVKPSASKEISQELVASPSDAQETVIVDLGVKGSGQPPTPAGLVPPPSSEVSPPASPQRRGLNRWIGWGIAILAVAVLVGVGIFVGIPWLHGRQNQPAAIIPVTLAPPATLPPATSAPLVSADSTCRSDAIGCVKIGPTDPIHIAYLLVVSGPNAALGTDARNGVQIAIDDAGSKLLNHAIKFDGQDGGCTPDGGQAAGTKLASDPTIVAVIGTSCSSEARAAEPLLSKAGFLTISPSNTAPDLTDPANSNYYPGYFRTAHNDKVQGKAAADFAYNSLGARTAATIHDGSLYASSLVQVFADNFKQFGGTLTTATSVDPNATDMSSVLASIATTKPDIIYYPIFLPAGAFITIQARKTPGLENTRLMSADGLYSPDAMKAAGAAAEGWMVSSPVVQGAAYDAFVVKYKAKFGTAPINIFHAHAYDAFNIVVAAIQKVAVVQPDGTIYIPRQGLRDAVAATRDFQGLTGLLTCSASGDCANPVIGVYVYHAGQYPPELIWPPQYVKK